MKIAIFTNDCPIQMALVNKLNVSIAIDTVFLSQNHIEKSVTSMNKMVYYFKRLVRFPFELPFRFAWDALKKRYSDIYRQIPESIIQKSVENINHEMVLEYIQKEKPQLIIVSATTMIKKAIIEEAAKIDCLILNLHTGISPYIKGGPNCTNWCLANNDYLIGNTVMTLDAGIDSGAIIATERTKLTGDESLAELHYKVMEHGFDLYTRVIVCYVKNNRIFNAIPQDSISTDVNLFYTKDWTVFKVLKAYFNYRVFYKKGISTYKVQKNIKLFPFVCEEY